MLLCINFWFTPISLLQPGNYNDILRSRDRQNGCLAEKFPGEIEKKRVRRFVADELLLIFKCVVDV